MRGEKIGASGAAGMAGEAPLEVPDSVPVIESDELEGARRRSARARKLDAKLSARADEGRPLGAREVDGIVRDCARAGGKVDGDSALVLAAHARRHPQLFGGGHGGLLRLWARVAWRALVGDLRAFIARVREQEAAARHREELKQSLEQDRIEHDERRTQLLRDERRRDDAAPAADARVDAKLDAEQRLRATLARMTRP